MSNQLGQLRKSVLRRAGRHWSGVAALVVRPRLPSAVSEARLQCCAVSGLTAFHCNITLWHKVINLERAK
jgi:hypothetical protein